MILNDTLKYIESTLDVHVDVVPYQISIPFFIKDTFQVVALELRFEPGRLWLMALIDERNDYPGIVKLSKMMDTVAQATDHHVIYVSAALGKTERRALVSHRINFIQPGYQMFLPSVGLDLRDHFKQRKSGEDEMRHFMPTTQVTLLERLYEGWDDETSFTSNGVMGEQRYSRATLGKVIEQLRAAELIEPAQSETSIPTWKFTGGPEQVFRKAQRFLRSPVKKVVGISNDLFDLRGSEGIFLAGETALSRYTMLGEPKLPVYGMVKPFFDSYSRLRHLQVEQEKDLIRAYVEIWAYPPLHDGDLPDEASLYLSLQDNPDEGIHLSIDELKERVKWLENGADL